MFDRLEDPQPLLNGYSVTRVSWPSFKPYFLEKRAEIFRDDETCPVETFLSEAEKQALDRLGARTKDLYRLVYICEKDNAIAGWGWGCQSDYESYDMVNTGFFPEHRHQGLYKALLPVVMARLKGAGFQVATSKHNPANEAIIKPKLDYGFTPAGFDLTRYGPLLRLAYYFNENRRNAMATQSRKEAQEAMAPYFKGP